VENPFTHNRATNLIGRVLDRERENFEKLKKAATTEEQAELLDFASLEYRIMSKLLNEGCLTEKALETVGLEGRYDDPKAEALDELAKGGLATPVVVVSKHNG
jgi:hypothetical protein